MTSWKLGVVLVAVGLAAAVPALAQDPTFPAAWAGIWQIDTVERDCTTHVITDSYSEPDTICTGQSLAFAEQGVQLDCTGTIDNTSVDVSCSGQIVEGPCTVTFSYTVQGTRSGESLSGTETTSITYSGCGPISDTCTESTLTGTRIASEPASCNTPILPTTWGQIKARYGSD